MEKKRFLEAGKIVNTHGIYGDVRITPWCDTPEFLTRFKTLYIDGTPRRVVSASVHKSFVLCRLEGVEDVDTAAALKNKVVCIDREDAALPKGRVFVQDLIGLEAYNAETGELLGRVTDYLTLPAQSVYEITGEKKYLIPDVPAFIEKLDADAGRVDIRLIEGLEV